MTTSKFYTGEWKIAIERCTPLAAKVMRNMIEREVFGRQRALIKQHYGKEACENIVNLWRNLWIEIKVGPHGKRLCSSSRGKKVNRVPVADCITDISK